MFTPLRSSDETKHRSYTRTEETKYVWRAGANGGGTVGATTSGNFKYKNLEGGKVVAEQSGSHAGMFGGEVDSAGKLLHGSTQHVIKDGDHLRQEVKGSSDPSLFVEKVGLRKPQILHDTPFDTSTSQGPLTGTLTEALNDFKCLCHFKGDPFLRKGLGTEQSAQIKE